jgi:hypothetical protein
MPRQTAMTKMQHRTATRLAWALWAIYLLVLMGAIIFAYLARSYPPDSADLLPPFSRVLLYLPALFAFPLPSRNSATLYPRRLALVFIYPGLCVRISNLSRADFQEKVSFGRGAP